MNYTLIKYVEDTRYIDRCGDWAGDKGSFDLQFSQDKEEFAVMWANAIFTGVSSGDDEVTVLINGAGIYDYVNDFTSEEEAAYDELVELKSVEYKKLQFAALEKQRKLEKEKQIKQEQEELRRVEQERVRDLATLNAIKKKYGVL